MSLVPRSARSRSPGRARRACASERLRALASEATDDERSYIAFHRRRYERVVELVAALIGGADAGAVVRILDVGPAWESILLAECLDGVEVHTLGRPNSAFRFRPPASHVDADLDSVAEGSEPPRGPFDVVVAAEVIEHLHTPPGRLVSWLAAALAPGGFLLLQTPNACALPKRLRMLAGTNPAEPLREPGEEPGHIREFTRAEVRALLVGAGLAVVRLESASYFRTGSRRQRLVSGLGPALPPGLRDGITGLGRRLPATDVAERRGG